MSSSSKASLSPRNDNQCPDPKSPSSQTCLKKRPSPSVFPHNEELLPISPIRPISSPIGEGLDFQFQENEDKENAPEESEVHEQHTKFCSTPSPLRYHLAVNDDMRQHLLVQRTINAHEEYVGPLTSSPLRKVPFGASPGLTPISTLAVPRSVVKEACADGHFNGTTPQSIFKTPVRGQHLDRGDHGWEKTPSAPRTPGFMSPASSLYAFTPGRQFVNPFEVDHERLHLPVLTPSMFQAKKKGIESSAEKETFWSVDQRAHMMPIEINESEVARQHFHQTRRDREMDPYFQKAIDQYFANGLIVPSPWSEKVPRALPQTPTGIKSVSCQTTMSVPPEVDLLTEIGDKYQLPDTQLVHESPMDSLAGGFIRRKLLNQLNENDSVVIGASPELPTKSRTIQNLSNSASPSPTKQVTPELEKQTPSKKSSGHFSSSPIRPTGDRGHHPAMSESDLLASPELSPIAGRGSNRPLRSSDVFTPHQEFERSREIMQLDFSSILDEPDEFDNDNLSDKTGTLLHTKGISLLQGHSDGVVHNTSTDFPEQNTHSMCNLSQGIRGEGELGSINKSANAHRKSMLVSALSAESTQDMATTVPNSLSSQDTGYQTASLQSITNLDLASNAQQQDFYLSASSGNHSYTKVKTMSSSLDSNPSNNNNKDGSLHTSLINQYDNCMPFKSELFTEGEGNSLDSYLNSGSRLGSLFPDNDNSSNSNYLSQSHNVCRIRKIRTLADIRRSKEKSNASRDLTSSFNEEAKSSTIVVRLSRSLSNPSLNMGSSPTVLAAPVSTNALPHGPDSPLFNSKIKSVEPVLSLKDGRDFDCDEDEVEVYQPFSVNNMNSGLIRPSACIEKRPFENIGNKLDSEFGEVQSDRKHIKLFGVGGDMEHREENVLFPSDLQPRFSLEDKSPLNEARKLLGKSEALRMQHDDDSKNQLEMDMFFQYISDKEAPETTVRSDLQLQPQEIEKDGNNANVNSAEVLRLKLHPVRMSTPDDSIIDSMDEKINPIEGGKLGSEIAAEILKRAEDDLAKLTS